MGGIARAVVVGTISRDGVSVRYASSGAACASFTLVTTEVWQDGTEHPNFYECECWGKKAEAASELEPGQLCVFEGKIGKRKKGDGQRDWVISGFELTSLLVQAPALPGRN
jgi:single-stranded DNA-binding protein